MGSPGNNGSLRSGMLAGMETPPDPEVRRRVLRLFGGVLLCGVVIAFCVIALVVLLDRFFAPLQK